MSPLHTETADIETASEDYASRFAGDVGRYFLDVQEQLTFELLTDCAGVTILDVGGGHAQLAAPLTKQGFAMTVTGSADSCRERLDAKCAPGSFSYITCDSLNLPFPDNHFDVVISFRLLPHAERWQELIKEMCRVASRVVIFDYPDKRSVNILYDILFELKKNMEGNTRTYTLFSRKELGRELEKNNFYAPQLRPEFFFPMVVHRKLKMVWLSKVLEFVPRICGLTNLLGSPIILRSDKRRIPK